MNGGGNTPNTRRHMSRTRRSLRGLAAESGVRERPTTRTCVRRSSMQVPSAHGTKATDNQGVKRRKAGWNRVHVRPTHHFAARTFKRGSQVIVSIHTTTPERFAVWGWCRFWEGRGGEVAAEGPRARGVGEPQSSSAGRTSRAASPRLCSVARTSRFNAENAEFGQEDAEELSTGRTGEPWWFSVARTSRFNAERSELGQQGTGERSAGGTMVRRR